MLKLNSNEPSRDSSGELCFDSAARLVTIGKITQRLEPKAALVLEKLIAAKGAVVSRQELLDSCWGEGLGSDEALTQAVAQIRKAVGDRISGWQLLQTVPRKGYRWLGSLGVDEGDARTGRPAEPLIRPPQSNRIFAYLALAMVAMAIVIAILLLTTRREIQIEVRKDTRAAVSPNQVHPQPSRSLPGSAS